MPVREQDWFLKASRERSHISSACLQDISSKGIFQLANALKDRTGDVSDNVFGEPGERHRQDKTGSMD